MYQDPSYKQDEYLTPIERKNYLRGSVGALLGALLGAIPWVIVYNLGWFSGWIAFIIAYCASFGFGLFGGKNSWVKIIAVSVSTFISIIVGTFAGIVMSVDWFGQGFFERFRTVIDIVLLDDIVRREVMREIGVGLLIGGIAVFFVILEMRQKLKEPALEKADESTETITDYEENTIPAVWGEASGTGSGKIIVTREKSFVGSAIKFICVLNLSRADFLENVGSSAGLTLGKKSKFIDECPNTTKIKNGETITLDIPYNVNNFYVVAFTSTGKLFSNEVEINAENMNAAFTIKIKMGMTENTLTLTQTEQI